MFQRNIPAVGLTLASLVTMCLTASLQAQPQQQSEDGKAWVQAIEQAQGRKQFMAKHAVRSDITVHFQGKTMLDGSMLATPSLGKVRIELKDGGVLVSNDAQVWQAPADQPIKRARFMVRTWPYFFAVPFKLSDQGVNIEPQGEKTMMGKPYQTARMTFDSGVGDTPDDWYLLYRDPQTSQLKAMVYIVTYGKSKQEAQKHPHAIVYQDFTSVDGVSVATKWQFRKWNKDQGIHGDPIGQATLSNIEFVQPDPGAFDKPSGARKATMPNSNEGNE